MKQQVDLTGGRFGRLEAVEKLTEKLYKEEAYLCICDCGSSTKATRSQLTGGRKKSCGCLRRESPANVVDITGQRFGMLIVTERGGQTKNGDAEWLCTCDCGKEKVKANSATLRSGGKVSCGCQRTVQMESARTILMTEKSVDGVQIPLLTKQVRSDSRTGHKGVSIRQRKGRTYYEAHIGVKGKRICKGPYNDLEKAIAARKDLEEQYHKPYIESIDKPLQ